MILITYLAFGDNVSFEFNPGGAFLINRTIEKVLETIYRQCNVVDGTEWIVKESKKRIAQGKRGLRSMSPGDLVTLTNGAYWAVYRCAGMGWEKLGGNTNL